MLNDMCRFSTVNNLSCVAGVKHSDVILGEAPYWCNREQKLVWVDIAEPSIHFTDLNTGIDEKIILNQLITSIVSRSRGGYIVTTKDGFGFIETNGALIKNIKKVVNFPKDGRFNDGKCDARGRYWVGSLALDASPGKGSLYCLDSNGYHVREILSGFDITNGMGWSPDNLFFYLVDSGKKVVYRFDFDVETGDINNKQVFYKFECEYGKPDGLTIDQHGYLWLAIWDGWKVVRLNPEGEIVKTVILPVPRPTSCVFHKQTLYITSARFRLSNQQLKQAPDSGCIFALNTGVSGGMSYEFKS